MTPASVPANEVFFDFLCPYAWRGLEMAALLREQGETFQLRHFSLVEGNHPENAEALNWRVTDQPLDAGGGEGVRHQKPSLGAFLAGHAAARQGEERAWSFTLALYRLHHEEKQPLEEATFSRAAEKAGLDLPRFTTDRQDEAGLRQALRADLDAARDIGVFGTPTFVLPGGSAAYYRFEHLPRTSGEAKAQWELYKSVMSSGAGIGTIKRAKNRPASKV